MSRVENTRKRLLDHFSVQFSRLGSSGDLPLRARRPIHKIRAIWEFANLAPKRNESPDCSGPSVARCFSGGVAQKRDVPNLTRSAAMRRPFASHLMRILCRRAHLAGTAAPSLRVALVL